VGVEWGGGGSSCMKVGVVWIWGRNEVWVGNGRGCHWECGPTVRIAAPGDRGPSG